MRHPQHDDLEQLAAAIRQGRCVAFVGAGFMHPSTRSWRDLLAQLTTRVGVPELRSDLQAWLGCNDDGSFDGSAPKLTSQEYEGIAHKLESALPGFTEEVNEALGAELSPVTARRLALLQGIPFHLVLTTNFDRLIGRGTLPAPDALGELLRVPKRSWWGDAFWRNLRARGATHTDWSDADANEGAASGGGLWFPEERLVKLHGDLTQQAPRLAFGTAGYRRLTHLQPGYRAFLRALFATHTVVYMGFSFTDAYINELRAEVAAHFGLQKAGHDYAILSDVPKARADHLRAELRLVPLVFDAPPLPDGGQDFSGFDRLLQELHRRTNPESSLRETISGRRILWFDPAPQNNVQGIELLREQGALSGATFEVVQELPEALAALRATSSPGHDVIISHWGHAADTDANAVKLLQQLDVPRPPVVVFASGTHREQNRRVALRHGAYAYTDTWGELFGALERLFSAGHTSDPSNLKT